MQGKQAIGLAMLFGIIAMFTLYAAFYTQNKVSLVGVIKNIDIVKTNYPTENVFWYETDTEQITIITNEVEVCQEVLADVRGRFPTATLPIEGTYGDLVVFDVKGTPLANNCYYLVQGDVNVV